MLIFIKENGTYHKDNIPLNKPKMFIDMSKTSKINPVSKRDGGKIGYILIIK